ncbi:MAG: lipoprotein signal peptidase [Chitinophagales bacterium]|nr:lipoprotein signal peptidase [Chitinophagales bacterium]MCZ2393830.1 lipoprotein signal peptidase [Chitinophagales bacterium]
MILLILIIDQIVKFWIKLNFAYGDGFDIFGWSWAKIQFVENEGMAFGWLVGGDYGKLLLTSFRMLAVPAGIYYIAYLIKRNYHPGLIFSIGLIVAGAIGNLIDSIFYGVIFNHSYGQLAQLFPSEGGYSTWLHGRVVDMFYFPLIETTWPKWIPFIGGKELSFFQYIFNIADSSISIGVASIIIFQNKFIKHTEK